MFRPVKNQRGFTLLEILTVMVIFSIVLIAMFQVFSLNYATMSEELGNQEKRDDLRVFNSYLIQDLIHSAYIEVQNEASFDALLYVDYQGNSRIVKFVPNQGVYEVERGKEALIAKGIPFDDSKPMLYEEDGLIYVNVYAKDINALMDFAIQPRVSE